MIDKKIQDLLKEYKSQPVGKGTIDCITAENIVPFLLEIEKLGYQINKFSW
ncbi:MAG: hypothetical protein RR565_09335 [Erysipelothrix sp.]